MLVFLNGEYVTKEEAKVSIFDHGLLYGDGVFEGIRSYNNKVFRLKEHINRLFYSAKVIMLQIPYTKEEMCESVKETIRKNNLKDAYVRVVVTRGEGDLGLDPRKCKKPTVFIIADKITLYPKELYERGLEVITVPTRRNIQEALNPCIKSLNYLNNILAKIEANIANAQEALMLSNDGYVCECTGENIFIAKNNQIFTPPTYIGALAGVTRDVVFEIAKENNIKICEKLLTRYDLYTADEVFLSGTAAEIVPVRKIDAREITNSIGPITRLIMEEFKKKIAQECESIL